ncbi:hypothetical protein [Fusibacter bizertensis]
MKEETNISKLIKLEQMDDIVQYLYMRDILYEQIEPMNLSAKKDDILTNDAILAITSEEWNDGSWGQFHSMSSSSRITTESAIRRLLNLGLDKNDMPIQKALKYMELFLLGEIELRDRKEKKHDWELLTRLFVSTWIRMIDSTNNIANLEAEKWAKVVSAGFVDEVFNKSKYTEAYKEILNPEKGKIIWGFQNFYLISLLQKLLSSTVESKFLDYILEYESGIYYIYDKKLLTPPKKFSTKQSLKFITAHSLLSKYDGYSSKSSLVKEWLFESRGEDGLWDFTSSTKDGVYLPLSNNWRKSINRKYDSTYIVMKLLNNIVGKRLTPPNIHSL